MLDVGIGTGIRAINRELPRRGCNIVGICSKVAVVADKFPSAEVIGVDLSPIQPYWSVFFSSSLCCLFELVLKPARVLPNVRFINDDINQEWFFPPCSLDFIHVRSLAGCIDD